MESSSPTSNPFSAAAVSGGRLPYLFNEPTAETNLLQTLERHQWIGQIVGPHGSGKTTLTHHLWTHAKTRFASQVQVTIRGPGNVQRRVTGRGSPCLYVVDGVERLSRVDRWLFLRGFSFKGAQHRSRSGHQDGLLVTGHRALPWLPKVFETSFDEELLNRLTREILSASNRSGFHDDDGDLFSQQQWKDFSSALLQRHGSNGREILMEIYDFYEANSSEKHPSDASLLLTKSGVDS